MNWADVPSVVRLASGELVAHWLQNGGANTYAYDVRLAYSKDDGTTCNQVVFAWTETDGDRSQVRTATALLSHAERK